MSLTARRLSWDERELALPLLEELAAQFPDRSRFEAWRDGALASLASGFVALAVVERDGAPVSGVLAQGRDGYRAVQASMGPLAPAELAALFEALKADARWLVWDDEVLPGWASVLTPLGARPFERQILVQAISRAWIPTLPDDGVAVTPWEVGSAFEGEAIAAMARAMADSLGGVFLTHPKAPSFEACHAAFQRALSGAEGEVLPWASGFAVAEGRLLGSLLCLRGEHDRQGFLYQIVQLPGVRKRLIGRRLIVHMQRALQSRGWEEILFMTMEANAPVHRLFRPEELVRSEASSGGYWQGP